MNRELLEHYANGAEKLSQSIRGLTDEDIRAIPDADANVGRWSIQQVVLHLCDCDAVFAVRMKFIIAEDNPTLPGFDENKWTAALQYDKQSAADAVKLFELTRKQIVEICRALPESAFDRAGTHTRVGRQTLTDILKLAVEHLDHHLKFIHAKRARMGKEMW